MKPAPRLRLRYGAGPAHLLLLVASFALAGAAVAGWLQRRGDFMSVLEWFGAAIVIHDLVLLPAYSLLDRIAFGRRAARAPAERPLPAGSAYVRIPTMLSGLLLLVFLPSITGLGGPGVAFVSGISLHGYALRWLVATAALFALSGLAYGVAGARRRGIRRPVARRPRTRPSQRRSPPAP